ncbi:MAG: DegQ family serine endoprotease [Deltaproteobacteria bacterium]|nr:DegQ family serine endoprotease [Deltaproteobacteria bacterium]
MRGALRLSILTATAVGALALVLVCKPSRSPEAAEKEFRIWSEGTSTAPVAPVPSGFSPVAGFADLVKQVEPAIVNISTTTEVKPRSRTFGRRFHSDPFSDDLFRHFFGDVEPPPQKRNSLGSGFVVNADGYILTNNHVVAGATEIRVKLGARTEHKAKVVGRDEKYDLALLKVEAKDKLTAVPFGDSDTLRVGDWVIAIGSPFGLASTVTAGIVSAKDRVIGAGPFDDFIQTDASINPGNSGGPLFNTKGEVVGINTAIHAAGQGIGFAVPVNMAKTFIRDVLTKGRVPRGWLGVGIQEMNADLAKGLGLSTANGVLVSQVFPGSPAAKADMKRGDVIVEFNGRRVEQPSDLTRLVGTTEPGATADLKVVREGKETTVKVTISEQRPGGEAAEGGPGSQGPVDKDATSLGIEVGAVSPKDAERLGLRADQGGVLVQDVEADGPAGGSGIRPGDVIMEVNRQPVSSPAEYVTAVGLVKAGESVLLLVLRRDNYFYSVVRKP